MGVESITRSQVYEKYADDLIRFATGLVGPVDAADIVADAMSRVLWSPAWEQVTNGRAYLYKAVLNEARRLRRDAVRRRAMELRMAAERDDTYLPEVRPEVLEAVSRLNVHQRAMVFLRYWEDLRPAEIARLLGLSEGTVHRHLRKGEHRLRRLLHER